MGAPRCDARTLAASVSLIAGTALGAWAFRTGRLRLTSAYPYLKCRMRPVARVKSPGPPSLGAPLGGLTVTPAEYEKAERDEAMVEDLHGVAVADPYRWLEDPDAEATKAFVAAQNELTQSVLAQCDTRQKFGDMFKKMYNYPKYGCPFIEGGRVYHFYNTGLQSHHVLQTQESLEGESTAFLDPNTWSEDGSVSLSSQSFSEDGSLVAYSISSGGSDWTTIKVAKVGPKGEAIELDDKLQFVKFSSMWWTHDNKGFFYCRYPEPEKQGGLELGQETQGARNQMLAYHVVGTPQSEDSIVYAMPDLPLWMLSAEVTEDGKYLLIYPSLGTYPGNKVYYTDLEALPRGPTGAINFSDHDFHKGTKKLPIVKLVDTIDGSFDYVSNTSTVFTFHTNYLAPRYRVVRTDLTKASHPKTWQDVIPEDGKDVLKWAAAVKGDNMVVCYLKECSNILELRSIETGALKVPIKLPGIGSIGSFSGDRKLTKVFFSFNSFIEASSIYQFDVAASEIEVKLFKRPQISGYDPNDLVTKQIMVTSKDGTKVPCFVTHKKGLKLDGQNPTLLYGYGGFNISLLPTFSVSRLCFILAYNGVSVVANLRGGGEYGIAWKEAGSCENKQNVFDDFQACAEHLINEKYTSPSKLAIRGGSNGGLLVAACANQRPDLYGCILAHVGVMDMLRFHLFTIGAAWIPDFGDPDNPSHFEYLYLYSPLHNVRIPVGGTRQYPSMLLTTGDHDDRVSPLHTHKLLATLQHVLAGKPDSLQRNPLIARIEVKVGHGAGRATDKIIEEETDVVGFMAAALKAKWIL
eukprot:evm.model.scf_98.5 EVM.evm.TU.scf_98.5   scf_98:31915-34323(+)